MAKRGEFLPVRISLVEQRGKCAHKVGDSFIWDSWIPPKGMGGALIDSLTKPVLMCALGAPSWEDNDPELWYISCPSKKGTVWKIESLEKELPKREW
ncbi:MAG: hypothetical protein ACYC9Q_02420 [Bacillota bacterium]